MAERRKGQVKEVSPEELKQRLSEGGGADRRTSERIPAQLEVEIPLATWEQFRRVYTVNISQGGLMFSLTSPASIPAMLRLALTLPDGKRIEFDSEVRHVARREGTADYEVGVQFRPLDENARRALADALAGLGKA